MHHQFLSDWSLQVLHDRLARLRCELADASAKYREMRRQEDEEDARNAELEREIAAIEDQEKRGQGFFARLIQLDPMSDAAMEKIQRLKVQIKFQFLPTTLVAMDLKRLEREIMDCERAIKKKERQEAKAAKLALIEAAKAAKLALTEAAAAAHFGQTREKADAIKRNMNGQIEVYPNCPYCHGPLGKQPHADHIFPVRRGGLSTIENLVFVCGRCNMKKRDKTLREFLISENLDRARTERVLEMLGKRF